MSRHRGTPLDDLLRELDVDSDRRRALFTGMRLVVDEARQATSSYALTNGLEQALPMLVFCGMTTAIESVKALPRHEDVEEENWNRCAGCGQKFPRTPKHPTNVCPTCARVAVRVVVCATGLPGTFEVLSFANGISRGMMGGR